MTKLGIAGYMGSGKSTFAHYLSQKWFTVFDADSLAKELMNGSQDIKDRLLDAFGSTVLSENEIQFPALGKICFGSESSLMVLNEIVHPPLIDYLKDLIYDQGAGACVLDAALIPLWPIENWFDRLYWVHASRMVRLQRLTEKHNIPIPDIEKRMAQQENLFQVPVGNKWTTLNNEGTVEEFLEEIDKVLKGFEK